VSDGPGCHSPGDFRACEDDEEVQYRGASGAQAAGVWSGLLAGGEQQVFPVHNDVPDAVVVAAGEVAVERGGPLGVVGYAAVGGDGRPIPPISSR
jgi:hypothetical protein